MAADLDKTPWQIAKSIGPDTKIVRIGPNATAGLATSLTAALAAQGVNISNMVAITIDNQSGSNVYLRTSQGLGYGLGQTGYRITGSAVSFAWNDDSNDTLGYEAAAPFFVMTHHKSSGRRQ